VHAFVISTSEIRESTDGLEQTSVWEVNGAQLVYCTRIILIGATVVLATKKAGAQTFEFCVIGDTGSGRLKIVMQGDGTRAKAENIAEKRLCQDTCGLYCAATAFTQKQCGGQTELLVDLAHAQSKTFCEDENGRPVESKKPILSISVAVFPNVSATRNEINDVVSYANRLFQSISCPIEFSLSDLGEMPSAYRDVTISGDAELKATLKYPADIKVASTIRFCPGTLQTSSIDGEGNDVIDECTSRDYSSMILTKASPSLLAILALRGYGHLAGIEESTDDSERYTLADSTLLIPDSPILAGHYDMFKISRSQCVKLIRYARKASQEKQFRK
jgi:hypothetical protein